MWNNVTKSLVLGLQLEISEGCTFGIVMTAFAHRLAVTFMREGIAVLSESCRRDENEDRQQAADIGHSVTNQRVVAFFGRLCC